MSDGSSARVERRSLEDDAFRIVSARDSLTTRLRNLWNRRELLSSLIRSDIRIKYKNSALGIVWSMLTPTLFLAIYWFVFARVLKNGIPNFVVYLFAGMVVWNMFNTSLSTATGVIVVRSGLVKKVSFPREILALANVGAATFYFFIQLCVFGLYLLVVGHSPDYAYFWLLPIAFLALYFFTAALAIVMSAVTVYMRDMEHFILIILQLWFFLSPIVYSYEHSIAPQLHAHGLAWLYFLNPITLIMLTFQRTFYVSTVVHSTVPTVVGGHVFPLINVLPSWPMSTYFYLDIALLAIMLVLFLVAEVVFGRLQGNFESAVVATVIKVEGIAKTFKIHHERHQSLKERLLHPRSGSTEVFDALADINFSVDTNETVGLVGHNGSGKSTLLKCICGVLQPTSGQIHIRGSLAALLELGAGFQPELSGRDNVYLYGAMLGFSKKMVDGIFDSVVDFSEIEQFIDTQVKFYSSGMYVRLAFAVAVNVDPDILVVDEVLAVGDERFQAKCIDRIRTFQDEGRSILFVTHNADQVRAICDRAIVLDGGHMIADGPTHESLRIFREHLMGSAQEHDRSGLLASISIDSLTTPSGAFHVKSGAGMHFDVHITSQSAYSGNFVLEIFTRKGLLVSRSDAKGSPVNLTPGQNVVGIDLAQIPLLDGIYDVNVGIVDPRGNTVIAWREQAASIQVTYDGREGGLVELGASIHQQ